MIDVKFASPLHSCRWLVCSGSACMLTISGRSGTGLATTARAVVVAATPRNPRRLGGDFCLARPRRRSIA
jgi:hypothetical protein